VPISFNPRFCYSVFTRTGGAVQTPYFAPRPPLPPSPALTLMDFHEL
jgi:hypothetical protein